MSWAKSKLNDEIVQEIRLSKGKVTQRALAEKFGISVTLVGHIQHRRFYFHLPWPEQPPEPPSPFFDDGE